MPWAGAGTVLQAHLRNSLPTGPAASMAPAAFGACPTPLASCASASRWVASPSLPLPPARQHQPAPATGYAGLALCAAQPPPLPPGHPAVLHCEAHHGRDNHHPPGVWQIPRWRLQVSGGGEQTLIGTGLRGPSLTEEAPPKDGVHRHNPELALAQSLHTVGPKEGGGLRANGALCSIQEVRQDWGGSLLRAHPQARTCAHTHVCISHVDFHTWTHR